ncbi:MAG: phosphate starvation-inducible protein PhoH [Campylobacteraceae bacterium]|jgi:PhoH-like ATPase|nr:phosphate starvation-inducible protein PhoH [Campylobacteraceae bacterium]MBT3883104.1 phosphate starvation-inducible protein PhoH [Campylobacteraceae bacterium]MBT4030916.1 phosphate starvation-inducible protein PhoH [Campylobacteraceae bacterium]MBT4179864.1 phosphate starvation-inducible protein PhoH [Campylobacteraceae bacterium]MBT4571989.1 phosphate starvation-inducible protein PhoH [Campylobacteraceae bacterium]
MFIKHFVLDTNIILEDASNIFKLSDAGTNLIVLPETVLDEVDSKKSGFDEINFQARQFARILENAEVVDIVETDSCKIVILELNEPSKFNIHIISKENYDASSKNIALNIFNDRKILEIAKFANTYYSSNIEFLSLDIMARMRAISLGIKASSLIGTKLDNEFDFNFEKFCEVKFEDLEFIDGSSIYDFDEDYQAYNFSYNFKVKSSDQMLLATIENEKIHILDEAEVRDQIVTPLNKEQLLFSHALNSQHFNVLIVDAKAGSGKTLLALSGAIKKVRQKEYQKIIYIRNSIESLDKGEDVGYLPGLEEKFEIYNHPLMDSLDYIVRASHKKRKSTKSNYTPIDEDEAQSRIQDMITNYAISTMWVGEMRGRTLSNAFIIIDEAQNMSNKTMQMVLSRIDSSCKVVILGSNNQIDNFYVNKQTNALTTLLKSTVSKTDLVNPFAINLEKVLRGPITQWAEDLFSNEQSK